MFGSIDCLLVTAAHRAGVREGDDAVSIRRHGDRIRRNSWRNRAPAASPDRWRQAATFRLSQDCERQTASGVEYPATTLTRSACRPAPVFAIRRPTCVLIVDAATPTLAATSGM